MSAIWMNWDGLWDSRVQWDAGTENSSAQMRAALFWLWPKASASLTAGTEEVPGSPAAVTGDPGSIQRGAAWGPAGMFALIRRFLLNMGGYLWGCLCGLMASERRPHEGVWERVCVGRDADFLGFKVRMNPSNCSKQSVLHRGLGHAILMTEKY